MALKHQRLNCDAFWFLIAPFSLCPMCKFYLGFLIHKKKKKYIKHTINSQLYIPGTPKRSVSFMIKVMCSHGRPKGSWRQTVVYSIPVMLLWSFSSINAAENTLPDQATSSTIYLRRDTATDFIKSLGWGHPFLLMLACFRAWLPLLLLSISLVQGISVPSCPHVDY